MSAAIPILSDSFADSRAPPAGIPGMRVRARPSLIMTA
jgi:hypothetical protein